MTVATLPDVLAGPRAVAGLVVLGWEEARAFVDAAEAEGRAVILQAGPGARAYMPLRVWGAMFRTLAEAASVPVVCHLDHGEGFETCLRAVEAGFSSVMYDGSARELSENLHVTQCVVEMARAAGVSVEAELGVVGYAGGKPSSATDPAEAALMAATGIDALAVSVGNVHLMTQSEAAIDFNALQAIGAAVPGLPLVLHGGSGIAAEVRRRIVAETAVRKFNIGTELRQVFGASLREAVKDPAIFDHIGILRQTVQPLTEAARGVIRGL